MFRAIGRYIRAFGYLITGRIDRARQEMSKNPYVVQATYDRIIHEKKDRIQQYKDAVARMIAQQEKKAAKVRSLTGEVNHLEQLKQGAAAKAKSVVATLQAQGLTLEQIKANEDYIKCMTAFNDFTSTAAEKTKHIEELETDLAELAKSIAGHKIQLQSLARDIDKLKSEANDAVADMITAREEEELADMISGISNDRTSEELSELRDLRQQQKAEAKISKEMAGTDTKVQEAEFLDYARNNVATDEFNKLIGLANTTDRNEPSESASPLVEKKDTQLPEG
jgi:phage shock protein A